MAGLPSRAPTSSTTRSEQLIRSPDHTPLLMGILNVTPDSFSDGGRFDRVDTAIEHGLRLLDEGADWIDIGGESTRPDAVPISEREERRRVVPVVEGILRRRPATVVSIDTSKASVAIAALEAGATIVNDVTALGDPHMARVVAASEARVVLMHMRGTPKTMQRDTTYTNLVDEVRTHLRQRLEHAIAEGIHPSRILLDPGLGFGKASSDNLRLLHAIPRFKTLGAPLLVGASRKRFIGEITEVVPPGERIHGSIGAAIAAASRGADVLRVHDVAATRAALRVYLAVQRAS